MAEGSGMRLVLKVMPSRSRVGGGGPSYDGSVGLHGILATVPKLLTHQHYGGLLPVSMAHRTASLLRYPSSRVLRKWAANTCVPNPVPQAFTQR